MKFYVRLSLAVALGMFMLSVTSAQNEYVGASTCKMCHQTKKQGEQFKIWESSKHAGAYKTLLSPAAQKIRKGAEKDAECLACHTTAHGVDAKLIGKKFDMKDGVQCEACHGAGDKYKGMSTMKDHAKAVAAGMTDFTKPGSAEAMCKTCHNEKSPTYKDFKFEEAWKAIAHPVPGG